MSERIAPWLALGTAMAAGGCATLAEPGTPIALCPATLPAASALEASGFRAIDDGDPPRAVAIAADASGNFTSVRFSDGPPEEQAWLAPNAERGDVSRWNFIPSGGRQTYLTCGYGPTVPALTRPIDQRQCSVRLSAGDRVVGLSCR